MKIQYIILLIAVFLFLVVIALHVHDDNKKIRKATKILQIPEEYIHDMKYLLLTIYKHHPELIRATPNDFMHNLKHEQHHLYHLIQKKWNYLIDCEIKEEHLVTDENRFFKELQTQRFNSIF